MQIHFAEKVETVPLLNNKSQSTTLNEIIPSVKQLSSIDKVKLIRILAEDLDKSESVYPLEPHKVYYLHTPYNMFGVAEMLMDTSETSEIKT